jgi:drug/metabolite transporter (DMT)-like permease
VLYSQPGLRHLTVARSWHLGLHACQLHCSTSLSPVTCLPPLPAGLFDNALADYLWSRAVLLIGPTIASVGLSLQVPIAMLVEPILISEGWWNHWLECALELTGAGAILAGFFVVTYASTP